MTSESTDTRTATQETIGEPAASQRTGGLVLPIVLALVGLIAIGIGEDIPVRHSVQRKLTAKSSDALTHAGVPFSSIHFVGRDGTVTVPSSSAGDRALAVVRHVEGVRVVDVVVLGQLGGGNQPTPAPSPSASAPAAPAPSPSVSASSPPSATPKPKPSPSQTSTATVQKQLNNLPKITFASASAKLTGRDTVIVKKMAAILKANPDINVRVEGDTDSTGPAAFNLTMSRRRATAVATELRQLGVAPKRLTVVGYGETRPKVPNDSPAHEAVNRRVDFVVSRS